MLIILLETKIVLLAAVPVEPVPDEEVNVKNVLESKESGNQGEIETPNAGWPMVSILPVLLFLWMIFNPTKFQQTKPSNYLSSQKLQIRHI